MAAPIVYDGVVGDASSGGQLFSGLKFWVAQRIPMRTHFLDQIRSNGGEVVLLEKKADFLIADHCRRDCPPGSISYEFIQKSIKNGELVDPDNHLAGPPLGTARDAGATSRPTKGGRVAYTAEEDRILYKWVTDSVAGGGRAGGNELYKDLEAKYPRHTWQSWRDRYLKHLCNRSPSAFNLPDDAPPSLPSDQLPQQTSPKAKSARLKSEKGPSAASKVTGPGKARTKEDISVDDLAPLFNKEEWEELYAFADEINLISGKEYATAWLGWAESRESNQTSDQWRQYFEKIVRPQWQQDPSSKRQKIRKRVEERHEGKEAEGIPSGSQSFTMSQAVAAAANTPTTRENKQIKDLPKKNEEKRLKRRLADTQEIAHNSESARIAKRRKSASPVSKPTNNEIQSGVSGIREQPASKPMTEAPVITSHLDEEADIENAECDLAEEPPSSPTPRAARNKSALDAQSIRSSPSQDLSINTLLQPGASQQDDRRPRKPLEQSPIRSPSPVELLVSEASTTHSLQEFRRSLNDNDEELEPSSRLSRPQPLLFSSSSVASSPASTSSDEEDPDPPLEANEVNEFFAELHEQGFDDTFVVRALRRTRCRPNLTIAVLDAWKEGKPLPNHRGIWSQEDDEDVESGDGRALARLEQKHTYDGWGGITERLIFLDGFRAKS